MSLSKRLTFLADEVKSDDIIADIGCDHALLDIYLIENNIVSKILVSDININALNNGIKNIQKHHLDDKIACRLGSGIEVITDDINTLIISGMGTNTIINILSNPKLKQINKLIIQSNNDYYLLRNFICQKGFYILNETVCYDHKKYYVNITFLRGHKKYQNKELIYGPILMQGNKDYFRHLLNTDKDIIGKIPRSKIITRYKLSKEMTELNRIIKHN
jgi:tRNA (adenine22-N1)-methyltransferase